MRCDVVVVGAGPAGSATALGLARAGANVTLVERRRLPRDKACGDGLSPAALELLDRLNVAVQTARRVSRLALCSLQDPDHRTEFGTTEIWGTCPRLELDHRLVDAAAAAGALVRSATSAEALIVEDGETHTRCDEQGVLAFTVVGSRVIHVCGRAFARAAQRAPQDARATMVHELLHSLGLGENPPSPRYITYRVQQLCW